MALSECRDCGGAVSSRAESCPHCGAPLVATAFARGSHVVIERTDRRWKGMRLWSILFIGVGAGLCVTPLAPIGVLFLFVAVWLFLWARVGRWWTNG